MANEIHKNEISTKCYIALMNYVFVITLLLVHRQYMHRCLIFPQTETKQKCRRTYEIKLTTTFLRVW